MRHLGVVQKKGMMGGSAELQLLAREEGEYVWRACKRSLTPDRAGADRLNRFAQGALVMVEISDQNQLVRADDGEDQLLALLQGFVRQIEIYKNQSQEIETWRESLQYQAEALGEREQEWQSREHELLTEIALLRAASNTNGGGEEYEDIQVQWSKLEIDRQQLLQDRQQLEEEIFQLRYREEELRQQPISHATLDPEILQGLQRDLSHLNTHFLAQVESKTTYQDTLGDLLRFLEQNLSELSQTLEDLSEQLQLTELERQDLILQGKGFISQEQQLHQVQTALWVQRGQIEVQGRSLTTQRQSLETLLNQANHQQEQAEAILEQCGVEHFTQGELSIDPQEIAEREQNWHDHHREFSQRSHLVSQQDEELRTQLERLEELQAQLQALSTQAGDEDEIADVEEEIDFTKQSCNDLRESVLRQKVRLSLDETRLNQEKAVLDKWKAQFDTVDNPPPNPHRELVPSLTELYQGLGGFHTTLQSQLTQVVSQLQELTYAQQQLAQQQTQWQGQHQEFENQRETHQQTLLALELRRATLETRLTTLRERQGILDSQQQILARLYAHSTQHQEVHDPSHLLSQLTTQLASFH